MDRGDVIGFWGSGAAGKAAPAGLHAVTALENGLPPEERTILERAAEYGASHVFFRRRHGRPSSAEALIFDDTGKLSPPRLEADFAKLHKQLWSWGAVPMVFRRTPGLIQLFRCAHGPDFAGKGDAVKFHPVETLELAAEIDGQLDQQPWFDLRRLANGTLWDDHEIGGRFLSGKAAHASLLDSIKVLDAETAKDSKLPEALRRRLLIICLLVAYLEDRDVFKLDPDFFSRHRKGASKFLEVLPNAEATLSLLSELETQFNGNVFSLKPEEEKQLRAAQQHLAGFARLIEGQSEGNQRTLWRLYSFRDLPVELISHIYQHFVEDKRTCVYTPPFLARLMLEEALSPERMERLSTQKECLFDPSCGSGIFLVEAFKRMVVNWRSQHEWQQPPVKVLHELLSSISGIDIDGSAVELASFSLCLAMCEELDAKTIFRTKKLFPKLRDVTLLTGCFFENKALEQIPAKIGVIVGNPPFESKVDTASTQAAYAAYGDTVGKMPDKQIAYLFLHSALNSVVSGGLVCLLQKDNFLYNRKSQPFRKHIFETWNVREILDFTPIRGLFSAADPKVVVVVAEANEPAEEPLLHAIFRRTVKTKAEHEFELDYYDMHWVTSAEAASKGHLWRCNLFGGGRAVDLVDRLKELPTLKDYVEQQGWKYGEGFIVGTPKNDDVCEHLYQKPVVQAKAVRDGCIDDSLIFEQETKAFEGKRSPELFTAPMVLIRQTDDFHLAYWNNHYLTYDQEVLGIALGEGSVIKHRQFFDRLFGYRSSIQGWLSLTSSRAGISRSTSLAKQDVEEIPFPENEKALSITTNEESILADARDYYRLFLRHGDESPVMAKAEPSHYKSFGSTLCKQINTIYQSLKPLPTKHFAGVTCFPFSFDGGVPDWSNEADLEKKLNKLLRKQHSQSLSTTRIVRLYEGSFVFLIKPDRVRYWLKSVALRDADEVLADMRAMGF